MILIVERKKRTKGWKFNRMEDQDREGKAERKTKKKKGRWAWKEISAIVMKRLTVSRAERPRPTLAEVKISQQEEAQQHHQGSETCSSSAVVLCWGEVVEKRAGIDSQGDLISPY
mmetsp:Transcript_13856/g.27622  ORF Transcript_13856/g.27622 Transcript_13856/m.27622 type:complete len:115 (-) Transcript_13856:1826-2170(-)